MSIVKKCPFHDMQSGTCTSTLRESLEGMLTVVADNGFVYDCADCPALLLCEQEALCDEGIMGTMDCDDCAHAWQNNSDGESHCPKSKRDEPTCCAGTCYHKFLHKDARFTPLPKDSRMPDHTPPSMRRCGNCGKLNTVCCPGSSCAGNAEGPTNWESKDRWPDDPFDN